MLNCKGLADDGLLMILDFVPFFFFNRNFEQLWLQIKTSVVISERSQTILRSPTTLEM